MKLLPKLKIPTNRPTMNDLFPENKEICTPKQIGFKFAGCRPVNKTKLTTKIDVVQRPLDKFHANIVIGKRKLFKPLIDKKSYIKLSNFCFTQI